MPGKKALLPVKQCLSNPFREEAQREERGRRLREEEAKRQAEKEAAEKKVAEQQRQAAAKG